MKLSLREKYLLFGLAGIIVLIIYYLFVFQPQWQNLTQLQAQAAANAKLIADIKEFQQPDSVIAEEYKLMKAKVDNQTRMFFPLNSQDKTIITVDQLLSSADLSGKALSFAYPVLKTDTAVAASGGSTEMTYYLHDLLAGSQAAGTPGAAINPNNQIPSMDLTIQFNGSYSSLLSFLSKTEALEKKMFLKSMTITPSTETAGVSGNVVFRLYLLPKFNGADADFLNWDIQGTYGTANPFVAVGGTVAASQAPSASAAVQTSPTDFLMSVAPVTADIPAVILGKSNDYTRSSYVYSDEQTFVSVSIRLTEKEGKYYYQFTNAGDTYPKTGTPEEFVPIGNNLSLAVYSAVRNQQNDQNGVNLTISNDTDKPFTVQILNDDTKSPRIKIVKTSGEVRIQ
ncbi:hypothetical protein LPY66_07305 [Dehalobacter sp. DCM]|uniref:hypothetical protein n=1 Tax=Dehalobacter sp. DCM TaxID=2907827 RepID=UPI003081FEF2|nr:hypothetical protein LPY66_07305 [Dehalobacter sp. DCM]